jgi:hypothetical protein
MDRHTYTAEAHADDDYKAHTNSKNHGMRVHTDEMHKPIYIYIYVYVYVYIYIYIYTHARTHLLTYIYTHIHRTETHSDEADNGSNKRIKCHHTSSTSTAALVTA